jgi:transposase-like protein
MWHVTSQKYGASALGLQRALGLGNYQTAWTWLHKLRRAMVRPSRDRLNGTVEVDETLLGGTDVGAAQAGRGSRGSGTKVFVAVAVEVRGTRIGRVRLRQIPDSTAHTLEKFVADSIEPGSLVQTDAWVGYRNLARMNYAHEVFNIAKTGNWRNAHKLLPYVHRVASLLKRWWLGTHQGAISTQHLDYYLDEFTFRFNRRASRSRGLLFHRLVQHAVLIDPVPYRNLVRGHPVQRAIRHTNRRPQPVVCT